MERVTDKLKPTLDQILFSLVGSRNLCEQWWQSKNKAFDLKTPAEVYKEDPKAVKTYLFNMLDK